MSQPVRIALVATATVTALAAGYAIYFDYRRRNDAGFRRSLRAQQKKVKAAEEAQRKATQAKTAQELRLAILELESEGPGPQSPEQQEAYFQEQVAEAEKLATMGPEMQVKSAMHFYRALRVYPQPVELLMIYQKVCPPAIFEIVVQAMQMAPGGGPSAPSVGGGLGGAGMALGGGAAGPGATVFDIDDASPAASNGNDHVEMDAADQASPSGSGASGISGASEWERVGEEAKA